MSGPGMGHGPGGGRPPVRRGPGGPGGPMGFAAAPAAKSKNFRASFGRLLRQLRPELRLVWVVVFLAIVSVFLAILGPKILGNATNIIFEGVVGKQLPPGVTQDQAVAALRAAGQTNQADMLAGMTNVVPGQGIDFTALAQALGLAAVPLHRQLGLRLGPGLPHGGRDSAHGLPPAARGGREAGPAAARLLRPRVPGRHPEPRHE